LTAVTEMIEFKIPKDENKTKSRIAILDFTRADFGLFRDLVRRISWDVVMREKMGSRELADFQFNI